MMTAIGGTDIYLPEPATMLLNQRLTEFENLFEVKLDSGKELGHMPGQFAEISVPGVGEAPISISSSPDLKGKFQMVVRRAGRVTEALHALKPGAKLGVRGPFGTCFPVEKEMKGKDVVFIAGGIGLAPLRSGIQYVLNHRKQYGAVSILYGAKTPAERIFADEIQSWSNSPGVLMLDTVDRPDANWSGNVGVITTLIPKLKLDAARTIIVACGPPVMYKFVIVTLNDTGIAASNIFVSLERRMKCGVGKCGHCQINGLYCCKDGPVFKYASIADMQEAI